MQGRSFFDQLFEERWENSDRFHNRFWRLTSALSTHVLIDTICQKCKNFEGYFSYFGFLLYKILLQ